jgi:hypothetical protein
MERVPREFERLLLGPRACGLCEMSGESVIVVLAVRTTLMRRRWCWRQPRQPRAQRGSVKRRWSHYPELMISAASHDTTNIRASAPEDTAFPGRATGKLRTQTS